ncbi:MAG: LamG-like jellyroll fold domain-containing protein [Planctomycetota bacterium]
MFRPTAVCLLVGTGFLFVLSVFAPENLQLKKPGHSWLFAEKPKASSVRDENGDWMGMIQGAPVHSAESGSLQFRGGTDAILIGGRGARLKGQAITLSTWVRMDAGARKGGIIGQVQDNRYGGKGISLGYDVAGFRMGLAANGSGQNDGTITWLRSSSGLNTGKWTHVACTYDGTTMRLFVDGNVEAASVAQSGPIIPANSPLIIGGYADDDERVPFIGAIHSASIYEQALSPEEVNGLFEAGKAIKANSSAPQGAWYVVAPYLQYPTTDSIMVAWETSRPVAGRVEYGLSTPLSGKVPFQAGTMQTVKIDGLKPGGSYFYRIVCEDPSGGELASPLLSFQTDSGPGSPFVFATIGDTQRNPRITGQVATRAMENRPAFVLHAGDVVDNGSDKSEWVNDLFRPCQELFGRIPVIPCIGNHERNHAFYYQYFALPEPEYHYQFTFGDADFFSIDSNKSLIPGSAQYNWLEKALASSKSKWKFCFHHHPAYSSDSDDYGDTFSGKPSTLGGANPRHLLPLYEKHAVDMVINGHVHLYERTHPIKGGKVDLKDGIVHLTTGGGGGGLENFVPHSSWIKAVGRVDYHTCIIQVDPKAIHLKAYDKDGILFDTWMKSK